MEQTINNSEAIKASYSAADNFPTKLLWWIDTFRKVGKLVPLHPQFILTNKCQLKCSYCSCSKRDRAIEMPINQATDYLLALNMMAEGITITGGGEPLLYEKLKEFLDFNHVVSYGLVTNGLAFGKWPKEMYDRFKWIRISMDGNRDLIPILNHPLKTAYSWVWTNEGDINNPNLQTLIKMAVDGKITHLRIVADILNHKVGRSLTPVLFRDCPNVIAQPRNLPVPGSKRCWIALVKPTIDATGFVYPCCGAQYAMGDESNRRYFPKELSMGHLGDFFKNYIDPQNPFNGSKCQQCYYTQYNKLLDRIVSLPHLNDVEFI